MAAGVVLDRRNLGDGIALAAGPAAGRLADPRRRSWSRWPALLQRLPLAALRAATPARSPTGSTARLIVVVGRPRRAPWCWRLLAVTVAHRRRSASRWCWWRCSCSGPPRCSPTTPPSTLLPMLVDRDDLGDRATPGCMAGFITVNQLVGPPIGAALFALGHGAARSSTQAVCVALGARPGRRGSSPPHAPRARSRDSHVRQDIAEGFRWVWHHAAGAHAGADDPHRSTSPSAPPGRCWCSTRPSVLGHGRGRLRPAHHASAAVGGLLGTLSYGWIDAPRQPRRRHADRAGHRDAHPPRAGADHARSWSRWRSSSSSVRTPSSGARPRSRSASGRCRSELQGRVGSVNLVGVFGGLVVGSGVGGVLAQRWGVDGAVLVRVRRLRGDPGADLGPARQHRPRRRGHPGRSRGAADGRLCPAESFPTACCT